MNEWRANELTVGEAHRFATSDAGVVIDTLPESHYEVRHIPGALNACVYEMVFVQRVNELVSDKSIPVLLYGAGEGSRDCLVAAEKLARDGYADVSVLIGGLQAWQESGLELDGLSPESVLLPKAVLVLEHREYALVVDESIINWKGRNVNGGHHGVLRFSEGKLDSAGSPSAAFIIDMTSIRNEDLEGDELQPFLETHLMSDDFFFTEIFPTAEFSTTKIKFMEEPESSRPNAMMQGILSLRGISQEIAFPVHIRNLDDGRLAVMGNLDFDRTQWGVVYGSSRFFHYLGMHTVYDFISVDFRIVFE